MQILSTSDSFRLLCAGEPARYGFLADGVNNWVRTPQNDFTSLVGAGDFTVCYWANCRKAAGNNIAVAYGGFTPDFWFGENGGQPTLTIGAPLTKAAINIANQGWKHLLVTRQAGVVKFYVNAVLITTVTFAHTLPNTVHADPTRNGTLRFGSFGGSGSYYNGDISAIRLLTRAVTAAEATVLMNQETPFADAAMYAEYLFPEGSGTTTASTAGITAILNNGAAFVQRKASTRRLLAVTS